MDSSTNHAINGTHNSNNQAYPYLDGIQTYSNEEFSRFFDPALFEDTTIGPGFTQQTQQLPPNFNQDVSRQSHSPLPQFNSPQPAYQPHNQYSQSPLYDTRQLPQQQNYDPRFYSGPSPSPLGFEGGYSFQPPMNYNAQGFNSQHMNMPPRQTPTPTNFAPGSGQKQQPPPYVNVQPSHLAQMQNPEMMHYGNYQNQSRQSSGSFVDPNLLSTGQMLGASNNNVNFQHQQSYLGQPSYFKAGSTVDPRTLQGALPVQPAPSPATQQPQISVVIPKPEKAPQSKPSKDSIAPKKTKKKGTNDPASDSEDELSIQVEEPPEPTPAILSIDLPTEEGQKAQYLAVHAVFSPRNKPATPEKVRGGIASFGDSVRALRDSWKVKNENLRKAELPDSPTAKDADALKKEVARYRSLIQEVMTRSLNFGHPSIVKRLGENHFTMAALSSFILDRFTVGDYDSPLTLAILKFVIKFETLDFETLEMTKLSKLLQRLTKKATTDIKTLAQSILENATAVSAKKKAASKSENPASPNVGGSPREAVAGTKRPREGESASQTVPKKVVKVQSSKPLALQNAERRKAFEAGKAAEKPVATSSAPAKAKVAVTAPPKSAVFSSLMSASKKPGTSIAARAAAAAKDKGSAVTNTPAPPVVVVKKEVVGRDSPPISGALAPKTTSTPSALLGLLADMEKKPQKEVKKEAQIPNETEEEKARRLRKEARKKLRVTWKADSDLVETRLFTHDPDEEIGDGDSLKRDAGDTGREGEALKLHQSMDDLDDEEDENEDSHEDFETYSTPSEVDFTVLENDTGSSEANFFKFGGTTRAEGVNNEEQNKREQETVMATYASKSDRPPTPKEPDENEEGDFEPAEPAIDFGEPDAKTRQREKDYQARQARNQPGFPLQPQVAPAQAASQQPAAISSALQQALAQFQPAQAQAAVAPQLDLSALFQSVQQINQQVQSQTPAPQYALPPVTPDLSTILANLQQQQQQSSQHSAPSVGIGTDISPYPGSVDDSSRKHARTDSNDYDYDEAGRKGGAKKKKPYNYKTQICSFWEQGRCTKGDSCTYRHGEEDFS
ncbi:uncharacterized protein PV06_04499 [Exophiala oligosperma]|uniref:C3H1-type domain-containing protein n=1 Tax=Exophiala oligosperma TaxID=215243 RepID=A0A0D2DLT8_9EURO|nr:uncharacterized protein PV06_04499 [Exophiala oligosperma]KIW43390.1 hypothetical protein PV06_04499 [Exophiala oligosperma]